MDLEADIRQFLDVFGTPEDLLPNGVGNSDTMATADSRVNDNIADVV